jgi:hypothetical protein
MLSRVHPVAGSIGFLMIAAFWISTVAAEMSGSPGIVAAVKQAIPWGLLVLVPALAVTGASGFRLAGARPDLEIARKKRRMPVIAGIGLFVLIPAALYLARLASRGQFDMSFYGVQSIELLAGAVNLTLMSLNIRDGLRLKSRRTRTRERKGIADQAAEASHPHR